MTIEICNLDTEALEFEELICERIGLGILGNAHYIVCVNKTNGDECCYLLLDADQKLIRVVGLKEVIK